MRLNVDDLDKKRFPTAADMRAHYARVKSRLPPYERDFNKLMLVRPVPPPVVEREPEPEPVKAVNLVPATLTHRLPVTMGNLVLRTTCTLLLVQIDAVRSDRRTMDLALARLLFCAVCRDLTVMTLTQIGRVICKDHTSVLHHLRKPRTPFIEAWLDRIKTAVHESAEHATMITRHIPDGANHDDQSGQPARG